MDLDRLARKLGALDQRAEPEWAAAPAAVLVPLYEQDGIWHLLFTKRTHSVDVHKGEISFPGGQVDDGDDGVVDTALREAEEEIGLSPGDVRVLGTLNPIITVTQFHLTPVVGQLPWPYGFTVNRHEVEGWFGVPIEWLSDPDNLETRYREPMAPGRPLEVYYFAPYDGEVIWGVTARITVNLLRVLAG